MYLSLRGRIYTRNSSYIDIDEIGEGDEAALLCVTDLVQCCRGDNTPGSGGALGKWFYPNGGSVQVEGSRDNIYRNRGPSVVRLHRRNNIRSPAGLYCCEVPDATNNSQKVCANIGK